MTDATAPRQRSATAPRSGAAATPGDESFIYVEGAWDLRHSYRRDRLADPFLAGLAEQRLLGVADPTSGRVLFPPRAQWDEPFAELRELVEVGPGGVIRTLTSLPGRGPNPDPPIVIAHVQLDGAASAAPGRLRLPWSDPERLLLLVGTRCHTLFADHPVGDWNDYWYELEGEAP